MSSGSRRNMVDEQVCKIPEEYLNTHVLLVDHDGDAIELMTILLESHRYLVTSTRLANVGVKMVLHPQSMFDIVIANMDMQSVMNHLDFVRQITFHKPHVPVIFTSKNATHSMADEALIAGAASIMWNPCQSKDLRDIWKHIERRKKAPIGNINNGPLDGQGCSRNKNISRPLMIDGCPRQKRKYTRREGGKKNEKKPRERNNPSDARKVVKPIKENHKKSSSSSSLPWAADLRTKFLRTLEELGGKASPQEVLDRMNVSDETWDDIGNHLQKYVFPMTMENADYGNKRCGEITTLPRLKNTTDIQAQPQQTTAPVATDLPPQALPLTSQAEIVPPGEHSVVPGPVIPSFAPMANAGNWNFLMPDMVQGSFKSADNNSSSIIPSPTNNHPLIENMMIEEPVSPVDFNIILNPKTADLDTVMGGSGNMGDWVFYEIPRANKKLVIEEPSAPFDMESMLNLSAPDLETPVEPGNPDDCDLGIFSGLDDVQGNLGAPGCHNPSSLTMTNAMNVTSHLGTSGGDMLCFSPDLDFTMNGMLPDQDDYSLIDEDDIFFF